MWTPFSRRHLLIPWKQSVSMLGFLCYTLTIFFFICWPRLSDWKSETGFEASRLRDRFLARNQSRSRIYIANYSKIGHVLDTDDYSSQVQFAITFVGSCSVDVSAKKLKLFPRYNKLLWCSYRKACVHHGQVSMNGGIFKLNEWFCANGRDTCWSLEVLGGSGKFHVTSSWDAFSGSWSYGSFYWIE